MEAIVISIVWASEPVVCKVHCCFRIANPKDDSLTRVFGRKEKKRVFTTINFRNYKLKLRVLVCQKSESSGIKKRGTKSTNKLKRMKSILTHIQQIDMKREPGDSHSSTYTCVIIPRSFQDRFESNAQFKSSIHVYAIIHAIM